MGDKSNSTSGGIGFWGLLQLLFIAFKLTNYIRWSWWWVLSPSLFSLIIVIVLVISFIIYRKSK